MLFRMRVCSRRFFATLATAFIVAAAMLLGAGGGEAYAVSAGCTAVNNGTLNGSIIDVQAVSNSNTGNAPFSSIAGNQFNVGDVIHYNVSSTSNDSGVSFAYDDTNGNIQHINSGTPSVTITTGFTIGGNDVRAVWNNNNGVTVTLSNTSTCTPASQVSTTTSVASSLNPSAFGQSVTFTATVSGNSPTGTVTFLDNGSTIGTGTVSGGQATFTTSSLAIGSHPITASYPGDANNFGSSSSTLTQVVKAATTTSVISSVSPITYGTSVTFTATVTGSSPTGTVTFFDGATNIGTGTVSSGQATLSTSTLTGGSHSITASYGGDGSNAGSTSSAITQQVNQASTTTSVGTSGSPSTFGNSVTFTATVVGAGATGTVTFKDGATTLGTGTLSAGTATFSTSTLSVAGSPHSITAVYGGDSNFTGSTSSAIAQNVNQASNTVTLGSSLNPSTFGQSVTFTATVTGSGATGTVTFKDGATTLGTGTLSGGTATFSTSTLSVATHSITAVYGGDSNFIGATSSALSQVVNQAATGTTLASSQNPSGFTQSVTFTATVTGSGATGTVTFKDGATTLGTGTLSSGTATYTTTTLSVATHSITAVYSGDSSFATSTSSALSQVVNQGATTVTLGSSLNPSVFGQNVTFTATISNNAATGTVTFKDGATTLGTGSLVAGVATYSTSALTVGGHSITAVYAGDGNFTGATSSTLTQTVNSAATTTTVTSSLNPSQLHQNVTFTATVTSQGGTPSGNVTFSDGATALGTVALAGGTATLSTTNLAMGMHSITVSYAGNGVFLPSTSTALQQSVAMPTDSVHLRNTQTMVTPQAATIFGQIITGAIDEAIGSGFSDNPQPFVSNGNGFTANLFAEPTGQAGTFTTREDGGLRGFIANPGQRDANKRVDDGFSALAYGGNVPTKAGPRANPVSRDWLAWIDVRGMSVSRNTTTDDLKGNQMSVLLGLTRKLSPSFLVGGFGGYEYFKYNSDALNSQLKGNGWTLGTYLGWHLAPGLRFDIAAARSHVNFDASAATATASFSGYRWLVSGGLTGTYKVKNFELEPSARVYGLWEHENGYTDSLAVTQPDRNFTTGRASAGMKLRYPMAVGWNSKFVPYVGLFGDYYFSKDDATALGAGSVPLLQGWSARAVGGLAINLYKGSTLDLGGEYGGIGSTTHIWTYHGRVSMPF